MAWGATSSAPPSLRNGLAGARESLASLGCDRGGAACGRQHHDLVDVIWSGNRDLGAARSSRPGHGVGSLEDVQVTIERDVTGWHVAQVGRNSQVVGDKCVEFALCLEPSFDEVGASVGLGRTVGDSNDAVDALAIEDAFSGGNGVPRELGSYTDGRRPACNAGCRAGD
jgi:hypothetical protein